MKNFRNKNNKRQPYVLYMCYNKKATRISKTIEFVEVNFINQFELNIYSKPFSDVLIGKWEESKAPVLNANNYIVSEDEAEDEREKAKFQELYSYYSENKEALAGYYDRGATIPPTRNPGVIHHARLGSMEGNVFTIIGNRMKGRRACWSIDGGNRLAALLCKHYSVSKVSETEVINGR